MTTQLKDLSNIPAGFANEFHTSQLVFRTALKALSYPGRVIEMEHDAITPSDANPVASGLLLALLDSETSLWCSNPSTMCAAADWLQFHTDCSVLTSPESADFLWVKNIRDLPNLKDCKLGTDQYPDKSATCVIEVPHLREESPWPFTLKGPGIQFEEHLHIQGWEEKDHEEFLKFWKANNLLFPCGIDIFFCDGHSLLGLPRTTQLSYPRGEA